MASSRDQSGSTSKQPRFQLTNFQYALLVLFSEEGNGDGYGPAGRSPYEIEKWVKEEGGNILGYSVSQVYKQAKYLAKAGFLVAFVPENQSRPRTYYEVTAEGRDALQAWYWSSAPLPPIDDAQAFIRLRIPGFIRVASVAAGLLAARDELELQFEEVEIEQTRLKRLGALTPHARLRLDLRRSLLTAYKEWLHRVDAEWGPEADQGADLPHGFTHGL